MGLAGYYRDFIPSFVRIAAPLSVVTRKDQPHKVEWGEAQEKAYQTIKSYLTSEPIYVSPIQLKPISYGRTLPTLELVQY